MNSAIYVRILLLATATIMLATAAFNIFVDPFAIFHTPRITGWNAIKPDVWSWPGIHKVFTVQDLKPNALILGTSRAEVGINPKHPVFNGFNAYNLGISGGNMEQVAGYFAHARAVSKFELAVLGLDLHMFNLRFTGRSDFDPNMFNESAYWESLLTPIKKFGIALGGQTFVHSLNTIDEQAKAPIIRWLPDGKGWVNPAAMEERVREHDNQRNMFLIDEGLVTQTEYIPPPTYEFNFGLSQKTSPFIYFRQLIRDAYTHNIALYLFISPVHARHLEVLHALNLWEQYETWQRMLVTINEEEAKLAGKPPFPIWDFSGYNSITMETVPNQQNAEARMHWYWESSHYRHTVGEMILNRLFSAKDTPIDFGVQLNTSNLETHFSELRIRRQRYLELVPQEAAEIKLNISKYAKIKTPLH